MARTIKKSDRVKKTIRSKIIATAICPLVAMSTAVSILSMSGYDGMFVAFVIAGILLVGTIQLVLVSGSIATSVRKVEEYLYQLASGNLDIEIEKALSKDNDELASMVTALSTLQKTLKGSMQEMHQISDSLVESGKTLEVVVTGVETITDTIQCSAKRLVNNAMQQQEDARKASENISEINDLIAGIASDVEQLKTTSGKMQEDGNRSMEIMNQLIESNDHTNQVIRQINEQIHLTYDAAEQITRVTEMITAIAKQTGLLALNASIEAARAGDAGRGFAVVAEEINVLASQSSTSAGEINKLISVLSVESKKMLDIIGLVVENAEEQKENLELTNLNFQKVEIAIEDSLKRIVEIGQQAAVCDNEKNKVTQHINTLKQLTEENVATTKDTQALIGELGVNISHTEEVSDGLRDYADLLEEQIGYFTLINTEKSGCSALIV